MSISKKFNYDNLPCELQEYDYYCIWGKKAGLDKRTKLYKEEYKRPRSPKSLLPAGTNKLDNFTDYYEALDVLEKNKEDFEGIGVVLSDNGLCCIDIDNVDSQIKLDFVDKISDWFNSYTEYSQSGNGFHIFFLVDFEKAFTFEESENLNSFFYTNKEIELENSEKIKIEFYHNNHSINLTGILKEDSSNTVREIPEDDFKKFLNKYLKRDKQDLNKALPQTKEIIRAQNRIKDIGKDGLLNKIRNSSSKSAKRFIELYETGNWEKYHYESESHARWFMFHQLAFWTAINPALTEEIYVESKLFQNSRMANRKFEDTQKEILKACKEQDPNKYYKAIAKKDDSILAQFIQKEGITRIQYNVVENIVEIDVPEGSSYSEIYEPQLVELFPIELTNRFNRQHQDDKLSFDEVRKQVRLIAYKNFYNPVQDYLLAQDWDRKDRFNELFEILHVSDKLDQILIRKWFRQVTQVAFNDTSSFESIKKTEGVLILSGPERIGKSSFFQRICPNQKWVYVSGDKFDAGNKDFKDLLVSNWIYCIDEIDESIQKGNTSGSLKSIVTQDLITYRKPYAENDTQNVRLFSLCGTTNKSEFIKSDIGERRWWVISLKEEIDFKRLNIFAKEENLQQFWAQAYYEGCEYGYSLTNEERKQLQDRVSNNYSQKDYLEELILTRLAFDVPKENWNWATSTDICDWLDIEANFKAKVGIVLSDLNRKGEIEKKIKHKTSHYLLPPKKKSKEIPVANSEDYLSIQEINWCDE